MSKRPCCNGEGLKKGAWTVEEDKKLISYIHDHGEGGWRNIPQKAGLERFGKSCRLRWTNYLKPYVKRGDFTIEEEQIIIMLHASLGNKWSVIARHLPKRTENDVKTYWNTHLKKRLINKETDTVTEKLLASNPSSVETKNIDSQVETNLDEHSSQLISTSPVTKLKKNQTEGSSSTSRLLNKVTGRAASIGNIISTSMEETLKYPTPSSCLPNSFKEDLGTTTDFNSPEYDFSQLLEQFMNDDDITENIGEYKQDQLLSDVPSTQVDEDITDWSSYLLDHPIFSDPFMARHSFTEPS